MRELYTGKIFGRIVRLPKWDYNNEVVNSEYEAFWCNKFQSSVYFNRWDAEQHVREIFSITSVQTAMKDIGIFSCLFHSRVSIHNDPTLRKKAVQ